MSEQVKDILEMQGPLVSTELVRILIDEHGLSPANARQKLSRSKSVKKLAYLPFPHNARFVYLQSHYASPDFWDALTQALLNHSISYGGGLAALLARGGTMPVSHFAIACGAPEAQKGQVSAKAILTRLQQAGLVQVIDIPGVGECIELSHQVAVSSYEIAEMRARLCAEELLLRAVKDWARNLNLVSYNQVMLRDEGSRLPKVGTFNWDFAAPSYLGPLAQWKDEKPSPGFLVCDVLLGVNISAQQLNEPPRDLWRLFGVSHAAWADSVSCR